MEFLVAFEIRVPDGTAAPGLDWLNKGIFIGVAGRRPGGVIYETYLVG